MALSIFDRFIAKTDNGETVPYALVSVALPGGGPVSLFADRNGSTGVGNPFTADPIGRAKFYLAPGRYNITVSYGSETIVYPDVIISPEITDGLSNVVLNANTTYNVDANDSSTFIDFTNASAKTVTVRPEADHVLSNNSEWHFYNSGAGKLTVAAGVGVTIRGNQPVLQQGYAYLKRVAVNTFDLIVTNNLHDSPASEIQMNAETGNAIFGGNLEANSLTVNGVPIEVRLNNLTATTNPTVDDDASEGYEPLSIWINTSTKEIWMCVTDTIGDADWQPGTLSIDELGNLAVVSASTVGLNLVQIPNPDATRFIRINSDNTISILTDAQFVAALQLAEMDPTATPGTLVQREVGTGDIYARYLRSTGTPNNAGTIEHFFISVDSVPNLLMRRARADIFPDAGWNIATLTNPSAIRFLRINADNTVSALTGSDFRTAIGAGTGNGTVTSITMTVPTGLQVAGSPITSSGTLAVTLQSGYSIPTTAKQTEWDTAYTDRNKWDGGATGLTAATGRTSLGLGTAAVANVTTSSTDTTSGRVWRTDDLVKTTSATDTTAGRMLKVGDGGLLTKASLQVIDFDAYAVANVYNSCGLILSDNGSTNKPSTGTYFYLQQFGYSTNKVTQVAWPYRSSDGPLSYRSTFDGITFNNWRNVWDTGNTSANVQTMLGAADNAAIRSNIGANSASNINAGTLADTYLPSTMTGKTFSSDVSVGANLTFTGASRKILGDFTNATIASRALFQSSTTNGETNLGIIPNGTSTTAGVTAYANATPTNTNTATIRAASTAMELVSGVTGSGTNRPMDFYVSGSLRVKINTSSGLLEAYGGLYPGNAVAAQATTLDWYERGTFFPVVEGSTTAGSGTYSVQIGRFQRIGNRVRGDINLAWSAHTGTGSLRVAGLPFTSANATNATRAVSIYSDGMPFTSGNTLQGMVQANVAYININERTPAGAVANHNVDASVSGLRIFFDYEV